MNKYEHLQIEPKWQKYWAENQTFRAHNNSEKPKFYALDMFPYPSGAGLHVGHPVGYTATDIVSRKKRHQGYNVLHPMGWDAFGLPAENYAIKTGVNPKISTYKNIDTFRGQLQALGFSYDWKREFATTDEDYFKWTQWLFLQMYKKGLLYEKKMPMNWCPKCHIVAANEEVEAGKHERCGADVERRNLRQWMFKITDYADRLISDLDAPNVVLLHGWGGDGESGWFGEIKNYLEKNNIEVISPDMPNTENPQYEEWKTSFEKNILPHLKENSILLGHSLGGSFYQKYLSENDLKVGELIMVAPGVSDCGISELKESGFFITKKGECDPLARGCSNGNTANSAFFSNKIIHNEIVEVKRTGKRKQIKLSQVYEEFEVDDKKIIFDGKEIFKHFVEKKQKKELRYRVQYTPTVLKTIANIKFDSENNGYFICNKSVFRIVLRKNKNGNFEVRTFYRCQKLSKELKELINEKLNIFNYEKIKQSVDNIFIFAGGKDEFISEKEFRFLADKLDAHFNFYPEKDHYNFDTELQSFFEKVVAGVLNWPEKVKAMQRNWIGRKTGINIEYEIDGLDEKVTCFTTRPDTNFGATFVTLAPEHELISKYLDKLPNKEEVEKYVEEAKAKSDIERMADGRKKTGAFTGLYVVNNLNNKKLPLYVGDFVLANVGTGAVVGVPGHDLRDFEFAQEFGIDIVRVVVSSDGDTSEITKPEQVQEKEGTMINSDFLDGLDIHVATQKVMDHLEEKGWGKRVVSYKLRDWIFTRQRYWGEPIPLVHCEKCGIVPIDESELPLRLPETDSFLPTADGQSPLAKIKDWVNTKCPQCGEKAKRETSTMPNWAGSNWYWLRYMDNKNDQEFCSKENENYWGPVDLYVGGAEHAVLHLLYSRFWHKVFYDMGFVTTKEPFKKLVNTGLILAEDGVKMSKSLGNVINPDEMIEKFGADSLRVYEMFMGPFEQPKAWSEKTLAGTRKFLDRVWRLFQKPVFDGTEDNKFTPVLHKTIKIVGEHIDDFKFNTAISQMMILTNELTGAEKLSKKTLETYAILFSPFAPHLAEEFWNMLGNKDSIAFEAWPEYDEKFLVEDSVTYVVQVNGKVRADFEISKDAEKEEVLTVAKGLEKVQKYLTEGEIKKEIFVPGKIVGFVVK